MNMNDKPPVEVVKEAALRLAREKGKNVNLVCCKCENPFELYELTSDDQILPDGGMVCPRCLVGRAG